MANNNRLSGAYLPLMLTNLGTTMRLQASITLIAALQRQSCDAICTMGILNRLVLAISTHSIGTGPGRKTVTDTTRIVSLLVNRLRECLDKGLGGRKTTM